MDAFAIETNEGVFIARYSPRGLCELSFPSNEYPPAGMDPATITVLEWHRVTSAAVVAIVRGLDPEEMPPLDLSGHTEFRRKVWAEMQRIPRGRTVSYAELAQKIGQPKAMRAVGGACGANPIPLIIPCHRVLAAGQRLGGFSGGLDWKQKLLAVEEIAYTWNWVGQQAKGDVEQKELAGFGKHDFEQLDPLTNPS